MVYRTATRVTAIAEVIAFHARMVMRACNLAIASAGIATKGFVARKVMRDRLLPVAMMVYRTALRVTETAVVTVPLVPMA